MAIPDRIRIVERKLGREAVWGLAHTDKDPPYIEVDSRLRGEQQLEIATHELLHVRFPYMDEDEVTSAAKWLARQLYEFGFRRVQL